MKGQLTEDEINILLKYANKEKTENPIPKSDKDSKDDKDDKKS